MDRKEGPKEIFRIKGKRVYFLNEMKHRENDKFIKLKRES